MKFSEAWLREWVNPPVNAKQLADKLTMAGLEAEGVFPVASNFTGVVVGEILNAQQHPNADRLRVCEVTIGGSEVLSIVCGAANARAGIKVATAIVGAVLSPTVTIKKTKLRGAESQGMLCSASELGLTETSSGIIELPLDAPLGMDLRQYLQCDDQAIELSVTPNRGDCLSLRGIAREVGAIYELPVNEPKILPIAEVSHVKATVEVKADKDCPVYVGRVIEGIRSNVQSPLWLQEKLRRAGMRSISAVVDVTNYVMFELGQPMHAFDWKTLHGPIVVRRAIAGETCVLIDDTQANLDADTLVIADQKRVLALAGVMGGAYSSVTDKTTDIFLEIAHFNPIIVNGRARHYGVSSEGARRFERGVDPQLPRLAMERATRLLLDIVGGKPGPITEVNHRATQANVITLRRDRIQKILGQPLSDADVTHILKRLGFDVTTAPNGWQVTAPSFRFDVTIETDLIEELARLKGYDQISSKFLDALLTSNLPDETEVGASRLSDVLIQRGYQEAITYSFVEPKLQALIDPESSPLTLANPISEDLSVMRTHCWPGLLQALQYNQHRQQPDIRLFEVGTCFYQCPESGGLQQLKVISGVATGDGYGQHWQGNGSIDFYRVKADVEAMLMQVDAQSGTLSSRFDFVAHEHAALHPGQSMAVMMGDQVIGWCGRLHPQIEQKLDLSQPVFMFELTLSLLGHAVLPKFKPFSKFPSIRRDIAVVVPEQLPAGSLKNVLQEALKEVLQEIKLFDKYQGDGVETGCKSIAIGVILQHHERTLTDDEVDQMLTRAIAALHKTCGARLRA